MKEHTNTIECFVCGKELENWQYKIAGDRAEIHPIDGLHFKSYGHYGTTVFDPMDGTSLDIAICDTCVIERNSRLHGSGAKDTQEYADMMIDAMERHG